MGNKTFFLVMRTFITRKFVPFDILYPFYYPLNMHLQHSPICSLYLQAWCFVSFLLFYFFLFFIAKCWCISFFINWNIGGTVLKNPPANAQSLGWEDPHGVGNGTLYSPLLLPGRFHGQRSLVDYGPWGRKELDVTEWLNTHTYSWHTPLC